MYPVVDKDTYNLFCVNTHKQKRLKLCYRCLKLKTVRIDNLTLSARVGIQLKYNLSSW